jgi:acyl carrier protein
MAMIKENQSVQSDTVPTDHAATTDRLLAVIKQLGDELQPRRMRHVSITLDSSLDRDLGFDSLAQVELLVRIEQAFDVSLPEQILTTAETGRDFLRAVLGAHGRTQIIARVETETIQPTTTESVPDTAETLVQALKHHVTIHPDRPHFRLYSDEDEGQVITYGQLWQGAERIARGLQQHGLNSGESVLIMLPTGCDYFYSFFGVLLAGGVPVPVYPPGRIKQIEEHLRRHGAIGANSLARLMITMPEAQRFAQLMHHLVEGLRKVMTVEELTATADLDSSFHLPALGGGDTAFLQYTSGSTGLPKGVVLNHANLLANIRAMGQVLEVSSNDIFVSWLPLYHDMGLIGAWLGSLYYGCPLIIMSPLSFIARPLRWLHAIHRYRGTLSAAPNFAYELCLRRIDDKEMTGVDLSSWRCAFNGAEAVSPTTIERFIERFGGYGFRPESMMPVYGLAESSVGLAFPATPRPPVIDRINRQDLMDSGNATIAAATENNVLRFVSCGQPLPGHQIRIVDAGDRELPDRLEGLLQFKGPSSTSGYFRNPEQTVNLFSGQWLNSGDMAYIAGGEVFITGRSKDIIIRAGRNIYPEELEEAVGKISGVREGNVAVFGSIDPDSATERLIVLAETRKRKPDAMAALQVAINTVVNDLAGTPPDEVVLAPPNSVLKTSSGKIRRAASRKLYESGTIGRPQRAVWLQVLRLTMTGFLPQLRRQFRRLTAVSYAGYCWLLFGLGAPVVAIMVTVLPVESWRWAFTRAVVRIVARCAAMPVQVQGLDNLPAKDIPCVLVSNHASYFDSLILVGVLPRCYSFVAKAELQNNFLLRFLLPRIGTEFVERFDQQKGRKDTRWLIDRGRAGRSLLFFAEGTFMRMPGLLPFRLGAFETAVEGNLPVVPLTIRGTRSIMRGGSWFPRRGTVSVLIGKPLQPENLLAKATGGRWKATLMLRDLVRTWILRHCGEPDLEHERPPVFSGGDQQEREIAE